MRKTISTLIACAAIAVSGHAKAAGDQIQIVGSSTVYPFVTAVAEEFGNNSDFKTPIVESTGTGGGFKLFCAGAGDEHPDVSNASRAIKKSEMEACSANGVSTVTELKIGFDGIVLANSVEATGYDLTKDQIFMALAKKVPVDGKLVDNPYVNWNDIDPALPAAKIEVYGPPTTSGTRDAFVELVMEPSCVGLAEFEAEYADKKQRKKACHLLREDGHYIEAGENDNLIVQKLQSNHNALGVFGYSFLDQNADIVQASTIGGVEATFENIASGAYGISRSLFVYVKDAHASVTPGLNEFVSELVSDDAAGEFGYLTDKGLIPLPSEELATMQSRALALTESAAK